MYRRSYGNVQTEGLRGLMVSGSKGRLWEQRGIKQPGFHLRLEGERGQHRDVEATRKERQLNRRDRDLSKEGRAVPGKRTDGRKQHGYFGLKSICVYLKEGGLTPKRSDPKVNAHEGSVPTGLRPGSDPTASAHGLKSAIFWEKLSTKQRQIASDRRSASARKYPGGSLKSVGGPEVRHHIDVEWMYCAYELTRKDGAKGRSPLTGRYHGDKFGTAPGTDKGQRG
jgi:hypothetical protein